MPPELRPFQKENIAFLAQHGRAMLADEPGLGKTACLLAAAHGRTLVLAPAMVLDGGVWADEHALWRPDLDMTTVSLTSASRRQYDLIRERFDTVIVDEAHYIKNRQAQMTTAVEAIGTRAERFFLATGTPVPNWAHELYMPLRMLHPGDRRWTSYWRWIEGWFKVNTIEGRGNMRTHREIGDLLETHTWEEFRKWNVLDEWLIRHLRKNHLKDLPPLTEQEVKVAMTKPQKQFYDRLKADYVAWVAETGTEVSAWSAGGLHMKLEQVQTGVAVVDPDSEDLPVPALLAGSGKLRAVRDILVDREGSSTVIFCFFRRTARLIARVTRDMGLRTAVLMGGQDATDRFVTVRDFREGQYPVLVGTIDTISEGLSFTAADTAIVVERTWRPYRNEQAIRRIHRMGQLRPVNVLYLVTQGGIDARKTRVLAEKTEQQLASLTAGDFVRML